jgi:hypothetical protein
MEYLPKFINGLGLIFNIIGIIVIWKYGLPMPVKRSRARYPRMEETDQDEISKAKKYDKRAKWGIRLLVCGFIFQLCSIFIPGK